MLAIGPGGEMEMAAANVSLKDPAAPVRKVGRGGLGAVFGAKRIKLITFDGGGTLPAAPLADRAGFTDALRRFAAALTDCPPGRRVPAYGAGLFTAILDQDAGNGRDDSPDVALSRDDGFKPGCRPECLIPGSRVLHGSGGHYLSAVPGVVGDWARGAGCCVDDPADVAAADRLMDDIGLDSIETGVMFGLAMEAGLLPVGDGKGVIRLLTEEIAKGTAFGRMLGGGTATLRRIYPQAGCTADSANDVSESSPDRRAATAVADSVGMCLFVAVPALDIPACATALRDMIGARFGDGLSADDWTALGRRVLDIETRFNRAAGVTEENDGRLDIFHRMPAVQRETGWSGGGAGIDTFWDF
jgi:aldehyde:ferredoxin oxidoreductase